LILISPNGESSSAVSRETERGMAWRETPESRRAVAVMIFDGAIKQIKDLVPGDLFRMREPDGTIFNPITLEPDPKVVCKAIDFPVRDEFGTDNYAVGTGYGVAIETFADIEQLKQRGLA
jgi:hypothetical protein